MEYLIIIFISPLYFLMRKEWGGFLINCFLYGLAWLTIFFGIGVFFWALGAGHAMFIFRKQAQEEQATKIAQKIVEQSKIK